MQILVSHIVGCWVIDRSHAQPIGEVTRLLLDPANLKVAYFEVSSFATDKAAYVRADQAILEDSVLTVASEASLGDQEDFLRDQEIFQTPCVLLGYKAIDRSKRRLGRITDYTVITPLLRVERLHIGVPFWQRLLVPERVLSARSVNEVLPKKRQIIIDQTHASNRVKASEPIAA